MEQTDVMEQTQPVGRPVIPESRWDPEKAVRRKVRVLKVPHGEDPMEEKTIFEFGGFVYICYAVKTRGRYMIRCLGLAEVEHERRIIDTGPAAKRLKDAIDDEVMKGAIEKEQTPVKGPNSVKGPPPAKGPTPFEAGKLLDEAKDGLDDDAMGDAIKEAIDDETVQQVIKEVTGDG